jgi:hypothetical protein
VAVDLSVCVSLVGIAGSRKDTKEPKNESCTKRVRCRFDLFCTFVARGSIAADHHSNSFPIATAVTTYRVCLKSCCEKGR